MIQPLSRLIQGGISLQTCWNRPWRAAVNHWLGPRLYLSHERNLLTSKRLLSVASSQIGRYGRTLPNWPNLLDAALGNARQLGFAPLLVPKTTLYEPMREFLQAARMEFLLADFSAHQSGPDAWLKHHLKMLADHPDWLDHRLCVSPTLKMDSAVESVDQQLPIQDRLAIMIPDVVYVLSRRRGGKIDRLLQARLAENQFPAGGVFINVLEADLSRSAAQNGPLSALEQQAVGWYVPPANHDVESGLAGCSRAQTGDTRHKSVQQLTALIPQSWNTEDNLVGAFPRYLVHCTRGNAGPKPQESQASYWRRVWLTSRIPENHPLRTLCDICREGLLRGNSRITRTSHNCVSLSAVPLPRLLQRRHFHSHLNRWDWEPYGILFSTQAMLALGAKPVYYGDAEDFKSLSEQDQPYFQARGTASADWREEREWRVLGNIRLHQLPRHSVKLFVKSRREAQQMARRFPWPVFWTEF